MHRYVLKRLLMAVLVLVGVAFVVFSIMALTPSTPGRLILGMDASQEAVDELNASLGYDKPFFLRFFTWIGDIVLHGDFGTSYFTGRPVMDEILMYFPVTFNIALYATIFSIIVGIPLGILSAVKQYSILDSVVTVTAMLLSVVPGFWLGLMLIQLFSLRLGWLPPNGSDSFVNYIMPMVSIGAAGAATLMRLTRSSMLETIRQDYIRTARAKGASEKSVIWKHALRNAMLPVITSAGTMFAGLLGGAVVTESVFVMNGLGSYIVSAIRMKNIPVVMAGTTFLAAIFSLVILLVDIIGAYIDPRVKAKYTR